MAVWNARALLYGVDGCSLRKQKIKNLNKICASNSVVGVLECHGVSAKILQLCKKYIPSHKAFHSPFVENGKVVPGTGGVLVLVEYTLLDFCSDSPSFSMNDVFRVIVPGRVARVVLHGDFNHQLFACTFVHNHDLTTQQMTVVEKLVDEDVSKTEECPDSFGAAYLGDFNLSPESEHPLVLKKPLPSNFASPLARSSTRPLEGRWNRVFAKLTEVVSDCFTHYSASTTTLTRKDRISTTSPRSSLLAFKSVAGIIRTPEYWYSAGLSDHAPVFWSAQLISQNKRGGSFSLVGAENKNNSKLALKREWCEHPHYRARMEAFSEVLGGISDPIEQRTAVIGVMRESAKQARDILFANDPTSTHSTLTRLSSISRCVWSCDSRLARILIKNSELGEKHITLENNIPRFSDPVYFEESFLAAKSEHLNKEKARINACASKDDPTSIGADKRSSKRTSKIAALNRVSTLWVKRAPRLSLAGVLVSEDTFKGLGMDTKDLQTGNAEGDLIITASEKVAKIIAHEWKPVFTAKDTDIELADELLKKYAEMKTWDWSISRPPTTESVAYYMSKLGHCSPGTDGVIPSGWKNAGPIGVNYISNRTDDALAGKKATP